MLIAIVSCLPVSKNTTQLQQRSIYKLITQVALTTQNYFAPLLASFKLIPNLFFVSNGLNEQTYQRSSSTLYGFTIIFVHVCPSCFIKQKTLFPRIIINIPHETENDVYCNPAICRTNAYQNIHLFHNGVSLNILLCASQLVFCPHSCLQLKRTFSS